MGHFVGLDISDATTNICIVNEEGIVTQELVVFTQPQEIISAIKSKNLSIEKIGMETGAKSNWLFREISCYYDVACYDACKMAKLLSANINKTDKNDARIIAEATRLCWFSNILNIEVHVKSISSQEIITLVRCRESLVQQNIKIYNCVRGILKTHGFSIPHQSPEIFIQTIREMLKTLPSVIAKGVRAVFGSYEQTLKEIKNLNKTIESLVEQNINAKLLMTIPDIGPITALYLAAVIDDPNRFTDFRSMGSYLGLTPSQYSSGKKELLSSISKRGDSLARKLLVGVARRILQNNKKSNSLKRWGQKIKKRKGKSRAAVALARHISVIALALLIHQTSYIEPSPHVKQKRSAILTTQELERLLKLSQQKGSIELHSMQQLKKMGEKIK